MNDDAPRSRRPPADRTSRSSQRPPETDVPGSGPDAPGPLPSGAVPGSTPPPDDPLAALERLQSLGAQPAKRSAAGADAAPDVRMPRIKPRPAAARSSLPVARIVAPAVFLVAVIVLISLLFQSGVIGGADKTPVSAPTPAATKTKASGDKSGGGTKGSNKVYVVKSGDTPSGIAAKYSITMSELEALNPNKDFTTLVVGEKVKVPKQ